MGDTRFAAPYRRIAEASSPLTEIRSLSDEDVIAALAAAPEREPYLRNVLASEAMNRVRRKGTIVETAEEGLISIDAEGRLTYMNPAAERMVGWTPRELHGEPVHDAIHGQGEKGRPAPVEGCRIFRVLHTGTPIRNVEDTFTRKDGSTFPVSLTAAPIVREGEVDGAVVTFTDVTERQRREAALRESEARKSGILEASPDAIITIDAESRVLEWNPAAERILGRSAKEAQGRDMTDLIVPERYREAHRAGMRRFLDTGEGPVLGTRLELPALRKDGTEFPSELTIVPLEADGRVLFTGFLRDLTDEKRARAEHREREAQYRMLVQSVKDYAIFMLDPTGRVTTWNRGAERMKGYRPEEITGKHFSIFYPEDVRARDHPAEELRQAQTHGSYQEEGWRIRKDGSRFWADVTITAVRDDTGRLRGFAKVTRDLTARKKAEEAAQRTHALEATNEGLEAFAYMVSHDLRAPLRGMDALSAFLLEDYGSRLDEEGREGLQRLRRESERMTRLVNDLLEFARATRRDLQREPVDVTALAHDLVAELQAGDPGREVDVHIEPGLRARADAPLLRVALGNLLRNAWKYTRRASDPRIEVTSATRDGETVFQVRDNGAGFNPEEAHRLFRPFQRLHHPTEFEGTGLGLATVERIVRRHGGDVWAEGRPGEGATFSFTLSQD